MTERDSVERIWEMVSGMRSCMLVTRDRDLYRARPMGPIVKADENVIYFFSDSDAHKDDELAQDPRACLTFADEANNRYVSLSGEVRMTADKELKRRLWSLPMRSQIPEGPEHPSIILLAFIPQEGEYWDGPSSKLVVAFRMAAAIVSGRRAELGENQKVDL
jgi:general stress protein 26